MTCAVGNMYCVNSDNGPVVIRSIITMRRNRHCKERGSHLCGIRHPMRCEQPRCIWNCLPGTSCLPARNHSDVRHTQGAPVHDAKAELQVKKSGNFRSALHIGPISCRCMLRQLLVSYSRGLSSQHKWNCETSRCRHTWVYIARLDCVT